MFSDSAGYWAFNQFDPYQRGDKTAETGERWLLVSHLPEKQVQALRMAVLWRVLLFV